VEPDSTLLVVLLLLAAGGLVFVAVRFGPLDAKIAAGTFAVVLAAGGGIAMVNVYYGYYQTWSQLSADLSGSYSHFAAPPSGRHGVTGAAGHGRMESVTLPGPASGISRGGFVYLPPQYFEAKYAGVRFPVVELLHGSPGNPGNWVLQINLAGIMDKLIAKRLVGPMIVVMPSINDGNHFQECVDAPCARDDTYVSQDVPRDIRTKFRASTVAAEWGIAGYSSGGYCAANLALRHPAAFGAAGITDAYFRPTDGPAAAALHFNAQAMAQNDPLALAQRLRPGTAPLPQLFVSASTDASRYSKGAEAFVAALRGVESVTFARQPGAGHNFYAWRAVVPHVLTWMWTAVAPPDLRVQFPVVGSGTESVVVPPLKPTALPTGSTSAPASRARHRAAHSPASTRH